MDGYSSYLKGLPPAPPYRRTVWNVWDRPENGNPVPLYTKLKQMGGILETEKRAAKILSAADGAKTYKTKSGGYIEVMPGSYCDEYVIVEIAPQNAQAYQEYRRPLPLWAYLMG